jgi:hypothetical protein
MIALLGPAPQIWVRFGFVWVRFGFVPVNWAEKHVRKKAQEIREAKGGVAFRGARGRTPGAPDIGR